MPPKTIKSSNELGLTIKKRRNELNLTIEEAAIKAGIGTKTWCRYESGESIRRDKVRGICKALKWKSIPEKNDTGINENVDFDEYRKSETWSAYLEEHFGKYAALSFVIGSDILLDEINEDISALSKMPKGSHIGESPSSFISPIMPEQFLVRYDYEFMIALRQTLIRFRDIAPSANKIIAHRVIDELVLYLIQEESQFFIEQIELDIGTNAEDKYIAWSQWAFKIFENMDIENFLYSDLYLLQPNDMYHFDNWFKQQFYTENNENN